MRAPRLCRGARNKNVGLLGGSRWYAEENIGGDLQEFDDFQKDLHGGQAAAAANLIEGGDADPEALCKVIP